MPLGSSKLSANKSLNSKRSDRVENDDYFFGQVYFLNQRSVACSVE